MTDGWLSLRRARSVLSTGLVALGLVMSPPGYAAQMEGLEFLEGLRGLKVPDSPAPESHQTPGPGKVRSANRRHPGDTRSHPEMPKSTVSAAQAAGSAPAGHGERAPGAGTTPPDADVQRLKAALAEAVAQRREQEKAAAAGQAQADGLGRQVSDLKVSLERAVKERDEARRQAAMLVARGGQAVKAEEKAQADIAAREAAVNALNAQVTGLQAALGQAEKVQGDIRRDMTSQLAGAADQLKDVVQARDVAQSSLGDAQAKEQQLRAELATRDASLKKAELSVRSLADVQQTLDSKTRELAALNDKALALTRERDALKVEVAKKTTAAGPAAGPVTVARHAPDTAAEKEAYVSGWQIAGMVRRARVVQTTLGLAADQTSFMAGLQDGVAGTPALPDGQLADLAGQYGTELESRERARFATGMDRLEKMTASKALVKRNGSVLFLRKRAGTVAPKAGMSIRGSLKESLLDGRVITDRRDITFDFGPALPAIVRDAIALGKVGSVMEVVCFGADIYPPEAMPADVYPWSLMQYTITTTGVVSEGNAVARGPVRAPKG
ncbi:hypothetical protein ACB496_15380 [Lelliottia nimipressuralis]|uniref:hypothetical protein n=1 Tax=Lelliottia nimipressuralis TaxID=69220 RepID=UPI003557EBA1